MIDGAPDSGNTPQRIFGFLLESYHTSIHTGIIVSGADDSASATSTTSKKPGDINEEGADGSIYRVYEVTVKPFDLSRIIDSYDCIKNTMMRNTHTLMRLSLFVEKEIVLRI